MVQQNDEAIAKLEPVLVEHEEYGNLADSVDNTGNRRADGEVAQEGQGVGRRLE